MKRRSGLSILLSGAVLLLATWAQAATYDVTYPGDGYRFNGGPANPPLTLQRGRTYEFNLDVGSLHPFEIKTGPGLGASRYDIGVVGNGGYLGTLTFSVPLNAPDTLYYGCDFHGDGNALIIVDAPRQADFDGDGKSDILWRNAATGENYVYPMDGLAILGTEGYARTVADQNWQVAGIGDFDGDGKADVLWRNSSTGENYVYLMNGKDIAGEGYIRTVADQHWKVAGVGDFDGDGKADIVWRNVFTGQNYLYPMDGLAILGTEGYLRTVLDLDWSIAGVGDLDGDGKADILWRNAASGENYLYPMNGTAILGTEGYLRTVADPNWTIVGIGDFTDDGNADVLWRNTSTGENYLYPMNGTAILGTEGYLRTVPDQNWKVQATGDYDGDGKADILWRHGSSGENYVYFMDGTAIKPTEGYTRTVAEQNWRVAPGSQGASGPKVADVVIAIDTSGDMDEETAFVQAQINTFVSMVKSAGVDLNVVVIAASGNFCAPAPLGAGTCPTDQNLPGYRHVAQEIGSTNAFQQILNTHPQWSGSIRPGSKRTLIVVSSDDSDMAASTFTSALQALDPEFAAMRFNSIVATLNPNAFPLNACAGIGAAMGTQYINLSAQTAGIVGNLCTQNFVPYFSSFAAAIVAEFP